MKLTNIVGKKADTDRQKDSIIRVHSTSSDIQFFFSLSLHPRTILSFCLTFTTFFSYKFLFLVFFEMVGILRKKMMSKLLNNWLVSPNAIPLYAGWDLVYIKQNIQVASWQMAEVAFLKNKTHCWCQLKLEGSGDMIASREVQKCSFQHQNKSGLITGGLTNPRPWRGRCRAGYANTGGPPLPRKRAPLQKKVFPNI